MPTIVHIPRSAPWLPPTLLEVRTAQSIRLRHDKSELKIYLKHKRIPVSAWCERFRNLTMSVLPGKWRNSVTPYLAGVMDASFFPSVRTIIICKAPQVGGTEAVLNCVGYAIDRDPGPVLCIYPDELTARENNQDRIQPMIKSSPRLRSYMTSSDDDSSILRISLVHMPLYMAWARSAARLANKPIRFVVFDEVDKYPATSGKRETDPISLGEARTITYRNSCKIWKISTPTTEEGNIWQALTTEAQVVFDFWVKCPACDVLQKMTFEQIKWEHETTPDIKGEFHSLEPETIEAKKLAWYECPHCHGKWNDYDRDLAVRHGQWRSRPGQVDGQDDEKSPNIGDYLKTHRPLKIGFHLPSWLSPFVSLASIAAAFLRGRVDVNKKKDFFNKHMAEPWKMVVISRNDQQILAARCELPEQVVPATAIALTAGIDVQQHGFWFVVRAWAPDLTNWLIHYGFLPTWNAVEKLLFENVYPVDGEPGRTLKIFRACVDTGGTGKYEDMTMTEETYFWIVKHKYLGALELWGTKGSSTAMPTMLSLGNEILATHSGKKLPNGLRVLILNSAKLKDQYHARLALAENGSG